MSARFGRRLFLRGSAVVAFGSFLPAFARRALAQDAARRKTLVFLFLRGALDGLHVLTPDEPRLRQLRPQLALEERLDLGVPGFKLHPSLAGLLPLWKSRQLAFVHATGSPDPTRSHFDAQDYLDLGTPGVNTTADGWLARALFETQVGEPGPLDAVAVSPRLPRSLQGADGALAFASLDQLRLRPLAGARGRQGRDEARAAFEGLYGAVPDDAVAATGQKAFAALDLLEKKLLSAKPSVAYPNGPIANALKPLAQLIKSNVGLRVGCVDSGGWDTHVNEAAVLQQNLRQLGDSLAAFMADLGPLAQDVAVVAATEFGRTARQNGTGGTDHGHGSLAFVLGGSVAGGRVHGTWPGLADDQLYQGRDLAVTTDLRSVLAAAAATQLGATDLDDLFPGFTGEPLAGLFG
ncbi:MAG TPA: DUF1501 domain-containing protein [Myxococcales bacterium]|jgi:uncharacterized protein (DUF1501 family)